MCGEATPGKTMGCPRLRKRDVKQYKTTATVYQECTVVNQKTAGRVAGRSRHGGDAPSRQLAKTALRGTNFANAVRVVRQAVVLSTDGFFSLSHLCLLVIILTPCLFCFLVLFFFVFSAPLSALILEK